MKWGFIPKGSTGPMYLVINADEGEPGTFKDRYLLERDPARPDRGHAHRGARHRLARSASSTSAASTCSRGASSAAAVKEAYAAGLLGKNIQGSGFDLDIVVHRGAGAYICGEETGLLSSLEGKKGWPKIKPPFPAVKGAFGAADHRQQRRDARRVPHIINARRRVVRRARHQDAGRHAALLGLRPRGEARASYEAPVSASPLRAAHLRARGRRPRTGGGSRRSCRAARRRRS